MNREEATEHTRVGGPGGQGGDRVAGPGLTQLPQQEGDVPRVVEAGVAGGVAGQQGRDRVAGPGHRPGAPGRRPLPRLPLRSPFPDRLPCRGW